MPHRLPELLDRAEAVLADLAETDLDSVADDTLTDAVLATQRLRGALEVAEARVLARWDAQGCWRPSGAKSAAAWLTWRQHLPASVSRQRMRHARALRELPAVEEAWASGAIDRSHVVTLLGCRNERTAAVFDQGHKLLLDVAKDSWFTHFRTACARFELYADPDGADQAADAGRAARELGMGQTFGGMWHGRFTLDPISGEIVHTTLEAIEADLFRHDWATARERLGRDPFVFELDRTPAQRRADALVEMAARARTSPADGKRPAPLFTILVGYESFAGPVLETHNRTAVAPGTAARWLDGADIERVVFDGPSRVIDVGRRTRFVTGALRRAIEVRDRTCFHPTCDDVPRRPEIDHVHPYAQGGVTTQANVRLGCDFHNRWRNHHPEDPDPP